MSDGPEFDLNGFSTGVGSFLFSTLFDVFSPKAKEAGFVGSESVLAPNANREGGGESVGEVIDLDTSEDSLNDFEPPNEKLPPRGTAVGFSCVAACPKLNPELLVDPEAIPVAAAVVSVGASIWSGFSADFPKAGEAAFPKENVAAAGATAATGDLDPNTGSDAPTGEPNEPNRLAGGPDFSNGFSGSGLLGVCPKVNAAFAGAVDEVSS